jgi:hypothetical protein
MQDKKIRVLVKEPYKEPVVKEIEDELENWQEIVGGLIECVGHPTLEDVDIYCDEEGLLKEKEGNFFLPEYQDCIKGTCFMVSFNDEGEFVSLTDEQIQKCKDYIELYQLERGEDLYRDFYDIQDRISRVYKRQAEEELC